MHGVVSGESVGMELVTVGKHFTVLFMKLQIFDKTNKKAKWDAVESAAEVRIVRHYLWSLVQAFCVSSVSEMEYS